MFSLSTPPEVPIGRIAESHCTPCVVFSLCSISALCLGEDCGCTRDTVTEDRKEIYFMKRLSRIFSAYRLSVGFYQSSHVVQALEI